MAEILDQKEIDALLNNNLLNNDEPEAEESKPKAANGNGAQRKHLKPVIERKTRFSFSYHSPVVKREKIVWNPDPAISEEPGRVVVRTLDNYHTHLRVRNTRLNPYAHHSEKKNGKK